MDLHDWAVAPLQQNRDAKENRNIDLIFIFTIIYALRT